MRTLLLAAAASIAAIAIPATPAQADGRDGFRGKANFVASGDSRCDVGDRRGHHDRRRGHDRRDRRAFCDVFIPWYGGEWALYNNRSFEPDSFNGWWHDRPDRAYPRWVQEARRTGNCAPDRMWWSGSGWHC